MQEEKIIIILGPTATGKTELGIKIAKQFNGEIINADSRTVYREMNIGTAKPSIDEMGGIKHWGFDLVKPDEHFQAFDFQKFAEEKIKEILDRGKLPIIVGGTGLYISGLIYGFNFEGGIDSSQQYNTLQIGILVDRQELYKRINNRVDAMIKYGLITEVENLQAKYGCEVKSMTGIGYRQICDYLNGRIDLEEAVRIIKRDSRHYAKRQITWFKRDSEIKWVKNNDNAIKLIKKFL